MIIYTNIILSKLAKLGKNFNWKKPESCPQCKNKLWGHGFVNAYFNNFNKNLYLKRYRCPRCSIVITLRPLSHWSRFRYAIDDIYRGIKDRLKYLRWPPWLPRQVGGHWIRRFISKIKMDYGLNDQMNMIDRLEYLYQKKIPFLSL